MTSFKGILFVCVPLVFSSCKIALFDELPGVHQAATPENLQGEYFLKVPSKWYKKTPLVDTLFLDMQPTSLGVKAQNDTQEIKLDSNNQLRLVSGKHLILASRNNDFPQYWNFAFVEPTSKGVRLFYIQEDEKGILPTYFQHKVLVQTNANDSVVVYHSNDSALTTYFEKVLRKQDAIEFIRLKK